MDSHELERLRALIEERRKIAAIKRIREQSGLGLREAKKIADAIERGADLFFISQRLGGSRVHKAEAPAATDEIQALLEAGKKIAAIKLYREQTGVGLKEAKEAVEAMEAAS